MICPALTVLPLLHTCITQFSVLLRYIKFTCSGSKFRGKAVPRPDINKSACATTSDITLNTMCDAEYHRPSPDPYIGILLNDQEIFWWEYKARNYSAMISSLSQWNGLKDHFTSGRVVVSLEDCQIPLNDAVYGLFHNKAILDKGSWARMNATLRQLHRQYRSSLVADGQTVNPLPLAIKLGKDSSPQSFSSIITYEIRRDAHNRHIKGKEDLRL